MIQAGLLLLSAAVAGPVELADHQPLPGYLQATAVQAVLLEALEPVAACFPPPATTPTSITVELIIDGAGGVTQLRASLEPHQATAAGCTAQALCSLAFPAHDEPSQRWSFAIAQRGGRAFLLPSPALIPRRDLPLFLYLPVPAAPDHLAWLQRVIGPQVYPPPGPEPLPSCQAAAQGAAGISPTVQPHP